MAENFTSNTFSSNYNDDYDAANGYHRILFNAGRALQARELTQLQTIIQEELGRLGKHFFKDGSNVNPGGVTVDNRYEFIKLNTSVNTLPADPSVLVGIEFTGATSSVSAEVIEAVAASGSDPATLFVRYTNTSSVTAGNDPIRMSAGEDITSGGYTFTVQSTNTTTNPAVGQGTRASIAAGDFFTQGHFVYSSDQSIIVSKYTTDPDDVVGFVVTQEIVTVSDDISLYDNTGATPDLSSPGADRYRIRLTIALESGIAADDNFITIAKISEGVVSADTTLFSDYNRLEDYLAQRTKEESGNYIANKFILDIQDNATDTSLLDIRLSPGVAYVDGYRSAPEGETVISIEKPRETDTVNNQGVAATFGNYYVVNGNKGIPNIDEMEQVNLRDATGYGGSTIGTARVRALEEDGGDWKVYVFNVQMTTGNPERNVRSLGTSATNYWDLVLEGGQAVRKETADNSLLFELPDNRPQSITDINLTVQRYFSTNTDGSGNATITLTSTGETFTDTNLWITGAADSDVEVATISGAGTQSATISGATPSVGSYEILAYVNKSAAGVRTKTLTETTETITPDGDGNLSFSNADIYDVIRVSDTDSDGDTLASRYTLDNGQRDNFYDLGSMKKVGGATTPSGDVFVRYRYFAHGAGGDFFAVNSYTGQVDYADIPDHTFADGTTVNLRDFVDFRPVVNSSGNFGSGAVINEIPRNTSLVSTDINYYKAKNAVIVLDRYDTVRAVEGAQSQDPRFPSVPQETLDLYRIEMNPYTLNREDLVVTPVEHKRFTMADIGRLEQRIDNLEELTSLSLLETNTATFNVLDENNNIRTKAGFFVDNFVDQFRSATGSFEHRAALDPSRGLVRPEIDTTASKLIFDTGNAENNNVVKKGDNLMLSYTETSYLNNSSMTGTENVNPFAVVQKIGSMSLSPESDSWVETRYANAKVVSGGTRFHTDREQLWDNWNWDWSGNMQVGTNIGTQETGRSSTSSTRRFIRGGNTWNQQFRTTTTSTRVSTATAVITGIDVVNEVIDDKLISRTLLPFMRSQKIFFKAEGLKPNTVYFPFFGGTLVGNWCRTEAFQRTSDDDNDWTTGYENATQHPSGFSSLLTDTNGNLEGSFFLPCTDDIKFRTGTKEFKLIDISLDNEVDATSFSKSLWSSTGILNIRQETILSTRHVNVATRSRTRTTTTTSTVLERQWRNRDRGDPLAQTFMVDEPSGVFITNVKLRFATVSTSQVPVTVELRPVVNGFPSADRIVPGSKKTLAPGSISTSTDGSAVTTFELDEPVYLSGDTEYCVVVKSDSNEYTVYVAKAGEFILGSTEKRLTRQATLGSLFKSQNSRTWTPDQTTDLTFELTRAVFPTSGTAVLKNTNLAKTVLAADSIETTDTSSTVTVYHRGHGFTIGDTVAIEDAVDVGGITAAQINGSQTVTAVDGNAFQFVSAGTATATTRGGGRPRVDRQFMYSTAFLKADAAIPTGTIVNYSAKTTTGKSLAGSENPWTQDTDWNVIFPDTNLYYNNVRLCGSETNADANLGSGVRSTMIKVDFESGSDYISPVLDMQRAQWGMVQNRIDNQAATPSTGKNVPISYVAETDNAGGSSLAKHVTKVTTLAEAATGLKIMMAAHRPSAALLEVYYRTGQDGENLSNIDWTLVDPEVSMPSDENPNIFRDYRFLAGGTSGDLDDFTQFQIKVVMKSTNASKVPMLKDLRVIALVD